MERTAAQQAQYLRMTETPIPKLIMTMAIPTIVSMLVTSIYNMADTYFVSQLGTSAAGAVGIVFSMMALIQATGFLFGMGSGANVSRLLGQQKTEEATEIFSTAFFCAFGLGLVVTIIGVTFTEPLMYLLGATDTILPYAMDYATYIFYGAPFMCSQFVLNNTMRSQGKATLSMIGIGAGGILNIILDPIFIFVFDMGIAGAAIATILSQIVSFTILISFYLTNKTEVRLHPKYIAKKASVYLNIVKTGMPSFARQGLASVASVALNVSAAFYGDAAVAAMSVTGRVFMFIMSIIIGFGQGFQPVIGFNYGAERFDRVKSSIRFTMVTSIGMTTVMAVLFFAFAPQVMALFRRDDLEVIAIGALYIRLQCLVLPFQPLITVSNMLFQAVGKQVRATFLAAARQGIFFLPLIFVLPSIFGLLGVQMAQPLADAFTMVCCIPMQLSYNKELNGILARQQEKLPEVQGKPQLDS